MKRSTRDSHLVTLVIALVSCAWACGPLCDDFECGVLEADEELLLGSPEHPEPYIDIEANRAGGKPLATLREADAPSLRALSLNVGNGQLARDDGLGPAYNLRLAYRRYEEQLALRIRSLRPRPQIISIQEVMPRAYCEHARNSADGIDDTLVCSQTGSDQVQRLLGPDYAIVCDRNESVVCLGVLKSFATIEGLDGDYDPAWGGTAELPPREPQRDYRLCNWANDECVHDQPVCDQESAVGAVTLILRRVDPRGPSAMRVVFLQPTNRGEACLQSQILQAFEMATEIPDTPAMIIGDWNVDPIRHTGSGSARLLFEERVGNGRPFKLHDEINGRGTLVKTGPRVRDYLDEGLATLDHVVSNFAKGLCRVHTDGDISPGARHPLGIFDQSAYDAIVAQADLRGKTRESYRRRRMDHRAVDCMLHVPFLPELP